MHPVRLKAKKGEEVERGAVRHDRDLLVHTHLHQHVLHELAEGREWMYWTAHHDHAHSHVPRPHLLDEPSGIEEGEHLHEDHVHEHDRPSDF